MLQVARVLLTITAIQYGIMPLFADLSETNVFHADWPPHARFHMVWLLGFGLSLAAYVMALVWFPSRNRLPNLWQASLLGFLPLLGFFAAFLSLDSYDGSLSAIVGREPRFGLEGNLISFSIAFVLQTIALIIVWRRQSVDQESPVDSRLQS